MKVHYLKSIFLVGFILLSTAVFSQSVFYKPGGGLNISSEEDLWKLRLLGYVQSTFTYHGVNQNGAIDNEFFIRRTRLDFIFDYQDRYQIFVRVGCPRQSH
ncbi:MAG: hypothetical protein GWN00_30410 [Aliifodinibius sp.]|nr:hypothetical protein [candidate division Zixibacteria bacterium]NIT60362.1 hypothetical protein [Fodinibius sp.]NIS48139.1 hypothetical protein [candidate division Zixibacteria bacterium]NIV08387.1 hypothetical protein [candidate division Zixibacteria bacterium]NIX58606.1 hypothetical protein [candidate division Zixibacteria bacterium]